MKNFFKGFSYNMKGFYYLIDHKGLWKYILIPLTINVAALVLFIALYAGYFDVIFQSISAPLSGMDIQNPEGFFDQLLDGGWWVVRNFFMVILFLLSLVAAFVVIYIFCSVVNAPFYELLSEKVLKQKGVLVERPFNVKGLLGEILHSLKIEICKLLLFICVSVILVLLGWIPVIGLLFSFLGFLFASWYIALGLCTYPMVLDRRPFGHIITWARQNKMVLTGFGLPSLVPVLGLLMIHFQVVGGTLIYADLRDQSL
ncbi:MAG: EI24 domain-containing protein [Deltaproteobacteria bacterium]|nr:EI24 domain-containing protein [Deltaproteobacteria bacterium]